MARATSYTDREMKANILLVKEIEEEKTANDFVIIDENSSIPESKKLLNPLSNYDTDNSKTRNSQFMMKRGGEDDSLNKMAFSA